MIAERIWVAMAGLSGTAAVGADAAARHLLAGEAYRLDLVATAARYGLVHAVALVAIAALARPAAPGERRSGARRWFAISGWCFVGGIVLFCGSLYALAAGAPSAMARTAPLGGVLFIAGWAALLVGAIMPRPAR